ncbi:MAG: phosphoribosylformylglycinamidine synthase I [Actinobacteria bacterium]|nr:phosphoribosylformylglycinamidine synthase I [Actinomycetota bacterium]
MADVNVLVLRTAGTNCDRETIYAFASAGGKVQALHINRVLGNPKLLQDFQILALPGGFSYGDDIAAGKILANQLLHHLADQLHEFVEAGKLIIGICNGFQVLVKTGLLPGNLGQDLPVGGNGQIVTLTNNDSDKFEDRWVHLAACSKKCVFLQEPQRIYLPIAHGEGKFVVSDPAVLEALQKSDQVAFRYINPDGSEPSYPDNPNGSIDHIAGITDPTGRILGLMPHPERHTHRTHHPRWTRLPAERQPDGLAIFANAVGYFKA